MLYNPQVTAFAPVGDLASLGSTVLTAMAKTFEQFPGDAISQFFTVQTISDAAIVIERTTEGLGITPLVELGQPDVLTDSAKADRMVVQPAHFRESDFIPQHYINYLRQVGTLNQKVGLEFVAARTRRLVNRANNVFGVLKAMALLGGINYYDRRTKNTINVPMNIPSGNLHNITGIAGRSWDTLATALVIKDVKFFKQKLYKNSKTKPTHIIMRSDLKELIEQHADIIKRIESPGQHNSAGFVKWDRDSGEITHICGLEILICDTLYEDPADGVVKHVWPAYKVALVAKSHSQAPGEPFAMMTYALGEDEQGRPGTWMRSGPPTDPPAPPGRSIQLGTSGLPWIKYPDWIGILTVAANEAAITTALANAS